MNILHQINLIDCKSAIGHHHGTLQVANSAMTESERAIIESLSPRKKSEWISSRELLFIIAGSQERTECIYDEFGKPFLLDSKKHISVSHSGEWSAAIICDRSCGVDIQTYSPTIERIQNKFLAPGEIYQTGRFTHTLHHLHLLWGAKESMYKAYGKKKLEFRQHIFIKSLDIPSCKGTGEIRFEAIHLRYDLHFRILPEAAWVFCIERPPDTDSNR